MLTRNLPETSFPAPRNGRTSVSVLGLGAGTLGESRLSDAEGEALLAEAVALGVTLIDTAPSYGVSEDRIGRFLRGKSSRRDAIVLSTKGGYGVPGVADWTPDVITRGIDQALARMGVDRLDAFFFHSCPKDVLARGDLFEPLARAKESGKIRFAGYSGENDALDFAVDCGAFDVVQCSVNPFDRRSLVNAVARAHARGIGVVAKRSVANAPWRFTSRPTGEYCEEYWVRMHAMAVDPSPLGWSEVAVRFGAFAEGVTSILVGTGRAGHLRECAEWIAKGPLPDELQERLRTRFYACDRGFIGQI
ncbi:MAG: aldo/keto reductase [Polyangiaceae bacterium]